MFDVLVIGGGAGGLACCWNLAKHGLKVCCIEQGPERSVDSLIPIDKGGEVQKFGDLSSDWETRSSSFDYSVDCTSSPISLEMFSGIGGSTLLFSAQYPRLHPTDFKVRTFTGYSKDWPIEYDRLKPFYELNEQITGLAGSKGDSFNPDIVPNMPPVPLGTMGKKLQNGFEKLQWDYWPAYSALNTEQYRHRSADDYKRPTNIDYREAKGSANNTYFPECKDMGVVFLTETTALELVKSDNKDGNCRIKEVLAVNNKSELVRIRAHFFVLSCGGAGTPRLLLSSNVQDERGLSNSSGLVGRNLMLHPWGYVEGTFTENMNSNWGPQGCCLISQHHYLGPKDQSYVRGFTMQVIRGPFPIEAAKSQCKRRRLSFNNDLIKSLKETYNKTAHIAIITDDLPNPDNRLYLSSISNSSKYKLGLKVEYKLSDNSRKQLADGIDKARLLLKTSGARRTVGYGPVRHTGWHILGTCCMGNDRRESVVNCDGRSHDIHNMYIADGSVFVTGGSVNPASTIQALGLYIGEQISRRLKNNV